MLAVTRMNRARMNHARLNRARLTRRRRAKATGLLVATLLLSASGTAARAQTEYVPWSAVLPGWTVGHVPTSENDCVAGRKNCVKHSVKELDRILQLTGKSCSHHAVFALAYTRITQTYGWSSDQPGYYENVPFANHQSAVFAKYYTDAWHSWRDGNRAAVPQAWLTAFDAAAAGKVTGTGDLLLGINAHINRDLAYVLAGVGLVAPDGTSRKKDYDKVEDFLAKAAEPMIVEAAHRFDPSMDDSRDPLDAGSTLVMQAISAARENAWRNAEALVSAPTKEARALVEARIERDANAAAEAILVAHSYLPPLRSSTVRDAHCAVNNGDEATEPYPFGSPDPYGS